MAATAALLPRAANTFGGEDPVAGRPWYHRLITFLAARAAGWQTGTEEDGDGGCAASALAYQAEIVDSYLYNPLFAAAGGIPRFRAALFAHDELVKVHFDDLTSTAQINLMWRRYLGGTVAGLLWAADRDDVAAARHIVGVALHALQDFYAHSNWVDRPGRRDKTWFEVPAAERDGLHLYTGTYEQGDDFGFKHHGRFALDCAPLRKVVGEDVMAALSESTLCRARRGRRRDPVPAHPGVDVPDNVIWLEPPGIALDSVWLSKVNVRNRDVPELHTEEPHMLGRRLFDAARELAVRHSGQWLEELDLIMDAAGYGEFMYRVRTEDRLAAPEELTSFERPDKLPMTFLSAGAYPPNPTGSDEGWFVRLELHTAGQRGAGTRSAIDAVIGGRTFRLGHDGDWNPLLRFDHFGAGERTWYLVGPFAQRPADITLINHGTGLDGIAEAAWEAFRSLVEADAAAWSWAELDAIANTPGTGFEVPCSGGYRVRGHLRVERTPPGELRASVRVDQMICPEGQGDPVVLMLVDSPAAGRLETYRGAPVVVEVPRHGGLVVPVQIAQAGDRDELLRRFAAGYREDTEPGRGRLLAAIAQALDPDWKLSVLDAYAFRRGPVVKTARLARLWPVDRWIEAGGSLTIPFGKSAAHTAQVNVLLPAITSETLVTGRVGGLALASGVVYAAASPAPVPGEPPGSGTVHSMGSHLEPAKTVRTGIGTRSVAVDPSRNRLYVASNDGVAMLDAVTLRTLARARLGAGIVDVAVDPGAGLVYASQWTISGGKLHVLRAGTLSNVAAVTEASGFHGPVGIAVDAGAARVYVARDFRSGGIGAPVVTALSVVHRRPDGRHVIERTVPLGEPAVQPVDVAVDPVAGLVYVAGVGGERTAPRLIVLDRGTHAILGQVPIPGPARAVAARPGTGLAYVAGEAGLTVVDGRSRFREITVPLGSQPVSVAVDPATGVAYVGDRRDGTITRVDVIDGVG